MSKRYLPIFILALIAASCGPSSDEVSVKGWVRSFRSNRFIALNDGSTIKNLQCVIDYENFDSDLIRNVTIGAAIKVTGVLTESQGQGQTVEIQVTKVEILGKADPEEAKALFMEKR